MKKSKLKKRLLKVEKKLEQTTQELEGLKDHFGLNATNEKPLKPYHEITEQEAWAEVLRDPGLRRDLAGL